MQMWGPVLPHSVAGTNPKSLTLVHSTLMFCWELRTMAIPDHTACAHHKSRWVPCLLVGTATDILWGTNLNLVVERVLSRSNFGCTWSFYVFVSELHTIALFILCTKKLNILGSREKNVPDYSLNVAFFLYLKLILVRLSIHPLHCALVPGNKG